LTSPPPPPPPPPPLSPPQAATPNAARGVMQAMASTWRTLRSVYISLLWLACGWTSLKLYACESCWFATLRKNSDRQLETPNRHAARSFGESLPPALSYVGVR